MLPLITVALLVLPCLSIRVAVTGAAGRTGSLVFSKLLKEAGLQPLGIVRNEASAKKLLKLGARQDQIVTCDITDFDKLTEALKGVDKVRAFHDESN